MATPYFDPAIYEAQHEGSESLAINNTRVRRLLVRIALHTTARFFKRKGTCVPITRHMILKSGLSVHLTEAATMKYVANHTSIPVPKVYCSFLHKNRAYIVMERIQGQDLATAWGSLSEDSLQKILLQLKKMIQELRSLPPPPHTGIESCTGGSLYDSRLPHGNPRFGPYKTVQDFHRWLRNGFEVEQIGAHVTQEEAVELKNMITQHNRPYSAPVFTHGDLNPFNILIRGHEIVGIIDWEFSGWYPPYWEYTSAWRGNITRTEWQSILLSVLDPYPVELEMEKNAQ